MEKLKCYKMVAPRKRIKTVENDVTENMVFLTKVVERPNKKFLVYPLMVCFSNPISHTNFVYLHTKKVKTGKQNWTLKTYMDDNDKKNNYV